MRALGFHFEMLFPLQKSCALHMPQQTPHRTPHNEQNNASSHLGNFTFKSKLLAHSKILPATHVIVSNKS